MCAKSNSDSRSWLPLPEQIGHRLEVKCVRKLLAPKQAAREFKAKKDTNWCAECRRYTSRRATDDEISFLVIVSEITKDAKIFLERCTFSLRNTSCDDGTGMDHGPFFSSSQSSHHWCYDPNHFDHQRLYSDDARHFDAIQVAFNQRNAAASRNRLKRQQLWLALCVCVENLGFVTSTYVTMIDPMATGMTFVIA